LGFGSKSSRPSKAVDFNFQHSLLGCRSGGLFFVLFPRHPDNFFINYFYGNTSVRINIEKNMKSLKKLISPPRLITMIAALGLLLTGIFGTILPLPFYKVNFEVGMWALMGAPLLLILGALFRGI